MRCKRFNTACFIRIKSNLKLGLAICGLMMSLNFVASAVNAQTPVPNKVKNAEEQYQSCSRGHYSGPRPGRIRYTKDSFIWVVTPEFAKQFCMPEEFVSAELKGAEAVAFRIAEDPNEEACGWADNKEACGRRKGVNVEIYMKSSVVLPKENDLAFYQTARLPSSYLVSPSKSESLSIYKISKASPKRAGLVSIFSLNQVGLQGVKNGIVAWSLFTLYPETFFSNVFPGIDYMAFHGQAGLMNNLRMDKAGVTEFVVSFRRLDDLQNPSDGKALSDYAHIVNLPKSFTEKMRAIDKLGKKSEDDLVKRAFGAAEHK